MRELYLVRALAARLELAASCRGLTGRDRDRPTVASAEATHAADELVRAARAELALHWATMGERP